MGRWRAQRESLWLRLAWRGAYRLRDGSLLMHIMEGYLPALHAAGWAAAAAPLVVHGARTAADHIRRRPGARLLLGAAGGFCFLLSALKLPSFTGSCSHATGASLGAFLFGPQVMALIGTIVLAFQALMLAHGGFTTLGANAASMAVVGPWVAYLALRLLRRQRVPVKVAAFVAAALADLATYATTAFQLALAFPDPDSGFTGALWKFVALFAVTQVPLAIIEGALTAAVMGFVLQHAAEDVRELPSAALRLLRSEPEDPET